LGWPQSRSLLWQKGNAKGDTFFASSGDNGSMGVAKQHRDSVTYTTPVDSWPASSPYVTSVGGTQLQYGWRWNPQTDVAFNADGSFNPAYWGYTSNSTPLNVVWNESWCPCATGGGRARSTRARAGRPASCPVRGITGSSPISRGTPR
jgi:subtilase family serine protease